MIQVEFKIPTDNWITYLIDHERKLNAWCKENCAGEWRRNHRDVGFYEFELEEDATLFALKWS
jgi:hypothetical protein